MGTQDTYSKKEFLDLYDKFQKKENEEKDVREQLDEEAANKAIEEANTLIDSFKGAIDDSIKNVLNYNGKTEYSPFNDPDEVQETGLEDREYTEEETDDTIKHMNVEIDPNTGEHKILGYTDKDPFDKTFDDLVEEINSSGDGNPFGTNITSGDVSEYLKSDDAKSGLLGEVSEVTNKDPDDMLESSTIEELLRLINRKSNGESIPYKDLPDEVKEIVDDYIEKSSGGLFKSAIPSRNFNGLRNRISAALMSEFTNNIKINKAKNDFAKELEMIYRNTSKDLADANLDYIEDRNKAYREAADQIEDEEKRERLKAILNRIDDARDITELKEFAKKCKIKKIEIEKYQSRVFNSFLSKYVTSNNNIYDINMALNVLWRHMGQYDCTPEDCVKFLILFCKYTANYSVDDPLDHAFMYYVLYNCAMLDSDKSETFKKNVAETIRNINQRNK